MSAFSAVRATNTSDVDFTDMYDGQIYTVPAHGDAIVPFDAACLWFGDPRLTNEDPADPTKRERVDEFTRVQVRQGWHDGLVFDDRDQPEGRRVAWDDHRAKVEIYDPIAGTRIYMVGEAPDAPPQDVTGEAAQESGLIRIERLEQELARLKSGGPAPLEPLPPLEPLAPLPPVADIPDDTPATPPRAKAGRTPVVAES